VRPVGKLVGLGSDCAFVGILLRIGGLGVLQLMLLKVLFVIVELLRTALWQLGCLLLLFWRLACLLVEIIVYMEWSFHELIIYD
jgi:hypothetical protein